MTAVLVGGIDPGPKPGLVILHIEGGRLLRVERGEHLNPEVVAECADYVAVEVYVRGPKSARARDSQAQQLTETMAREVRQHCSRLGKACQALPAGSVKPWATDERLREYLIGDPMTWPLSLYYYTRGGGGHDRDAARGALYFAVKLGLLARR